MKNKAVVLGANYYIGLSIIRCLGTKGIHVTSIDYSKEGSYGAKSKYLNESLIAPHYKKDQTAFLNFLIDYGKKEVYKPVLFPSADLYVEFVDKHFDILKKYYLIPQTKQGLYSKVMNKDHLSHLALKHNILIPETIEIKDNYIKEVNEKIKYPCLVKPTDSASFVAIFRKKMFKAYNEKQLINAVKVSQEANLDIIVQRIIPGFDDHMYTYDAYLNQDSRVTHWVTCQKHRQYPINYGASVYTGHKYVPELHKIGSEFLESIGYKGFAEIEFKKDAESGKYYLIEVNVRITTLNVLIDKLGINIPYITYKELTGNPIKPFSIKKESTLFFWYAYEDFIAVKNYIKTKQLSLMKVLKSYFKPKAYAIWDMKDPKPFIYFIGYKLKRLIRKLKLK
ncbi:carboxylate--amine ligase [Clostridiaceae bacterium M8S5]|nr:carboxylate--amine ligase [Clostridiaceae bacterium M8S5]